MSALITQRFDLAFDQDEFRWPSWYEVAYRPIGLFLDDAPLSGQIADKEHLPSPVLIGGGEGTGSHRSEIRAVRTYSGLSPWLEGILTGYLKEARTEQERIRDVPEALGAVRHYLSLNTTELARVLGVSRPTVYSWAENGPIKPENRKRLEKLWRITQEWRSISEKPAGTLVRDPGPDGQSLLALLEADPINDLMVSRQLEWIGREAAREVTTTGKSSMRELAQRFGLEPNPEKVVEETVRSAVQSAHRSRK